ncbi:MAG: hypothetical protein ABR949_10265 [Candidatus Aquilonibacter sp.]|jgi:hypothetical protein
MGKLKTVSTNGKPPEKTEPTSRANLEKKIAEATQQRDGHLNIAQQFNGAILAYQNLLAEMDEAENPTPAQ